MTNVFKTNINARKLGYGAGRAVVYIILTVIAAVMLLPVVFLITNSFMSSFDIYYNTLKIGEYSVLKMIPDMISIEQYYTALMSTPEFLIMFWNSCILTIPTVAGQVLIAVVAAYGFAKFKFPLRDKIFNVFIITMLMPIVVTLVPNYMTAKFFGLTDTYSSVILPGVFSAFGVFLMRQYMKTIPDSFSEAAKIDGANEATVFFRVVLPQCRSGIAALVILSFIDNWNMYEMPSILIQKPTMQPLSVYLSKLFYYSNGTVYACAMLFAIPVILLFFLGEEYLVSGIEHTEL